jgi:hypothetical protein
MNHVIPNLGDVADKDKRNKRQSRRANRKPDFQIKISVINEAERILGHLPIEIFILQDEFVNVL